MLNHLNCIAEKLCFLTSCAVIIGVVGAGIMTSMGIF